MAANMRRQFHLQSQLDNEVLNLSLSLSLSLFL